MTKPKTWVMEFDRVEVIPEQVASVLGAKVRVFLECPEGKAVWWNGPGWYFRDEVGDLHGPFGTIDEAEYGRREYAGSLI